MCNPDEEYCDLTFQLLLVSCAVTWCLPFHGFRNRLLFDPPAGRMGSHSSACGGRQGIALCGTSEFEIHPKTGLSQAAVLCVCLWAIVAADERLCNKEPFSYCPFGLDCSKQKQLPGNHDKPKQRNNYQHLDSVTLQYSFKVEEFDHKMEWQQRFFIPTGSLLWLTHPKSESQGWGRTRFWSQKMVGLLKAVSRVLRARAPCFEVYIALLLK